MKRRKDSGFTLIELMIVIAVIGILAIVLIPKVGTVKTQSKETGLDVNVRAVQGYCESKIDKWISKTLSTTDISADIDAAFTGDNKTLTNPFTAQSLPAVTVAAVSGVVDVPGTANYSVFIANGSNDTCSSTGPGADVTGQTNLDGAILVVFQNDGTDPIEGIWIYAYDQNGNLISEKTAHIIP